MDKNEKNGTIYYITYPEYQAKNEKGSKFPTGHAGVLFVDNTGVTKFREYGRYANRGKQDGIIGRVNDPVAVPNVKMENGKPSVQSLQRVLAKLSHHQYGPKGGKVAAMPYSVKDVRKGLDYADSLYNERLNPDRAKKGNKYEILSNNCSTFANECINRSGGDAPSRGLKHILPVANTWLNFEDIEYIPKRKLGGKMPTINDMYKFYKKNK